MPTPTFHLDRYLDRIGLPVSPRTDLDGLGAVQAAQLRAVPFENLDVIMGGGIEVEPDAVFRKLVTNERGGYCFECNGLLCNALLALGFDARLLLGRVVGDRVDGTVPARTHAIVEVQLDGAPYIADCGFGARTMRAPIRLEDGATCADDVGRGGCRVQRDDAFGWRLARTAPGEPDRDLFVFDQLIVYPADIAIGNHWTSTHPSCHFTQRPLVVRHTDAGRRVLNGRRFTVHEGGEPAEQALDSAAEWLAAIRDRFGIALEPSAAQLEALWGMATAAEF
ncbi:MAG: arylamine N-acetyltransferase family protein [Planctomycetota bacterium]|jgi:N-hydroxyarylamine O-acetyltransferase